MKIRRLVGIAMLATPFGIMGWLAVAIVELWEILAILIAVFVYILWMTVAFKLLEAT